MYAVLGSIRAMRVSVQGRGAVDTGTDRRSQEAH